jgi:hypothetical protein
MPTNETNQAARAQTRQEIKGLSLDVSIVRFFLDLLSVLHASSSEHLPFAYIQPPAVLSTSFLSRVEAFSLWDRVAGLPLARP